MAILNYTTKIKPEKTISEIQRILALKGATQVSTDYNNGSVSAVCFTIDYNGTTLRYRLPCNTEGVLLCLDDTPLPEAKKTIDHAEGVAWRILKDWVEAQMALIESNQSQIEEVFLPYMIHENNQTMFQVFENQQKQLTE